MRPSEPAAASGEGFQTRPAGPRTPRSIRFADAEWVRIEHCARARGMTTAELVRHAAVSFAGGRRAAHSGTFRPDIAAQIERMYRGVHLLSTLKRDELIRDGRQRELERVLEDARESQASIRSEAAEP